MMFHVSKLLLFNLLYVYIVLYCTCQIKIQVRKTARSDFKMRKRNSFPRVGAVDWWSNLRCVLLREALLFTSELLLVLPLLQHHAKNARVHLLGCNIRVKEKEQETNSLLAIG